MNNYDDVLSRLQENVELKQKYGGKGEPELSAIKAIKELIKKRDTAIADIESMILNVKSDAACRYCKYFLEFDKCEALVFDEGCKPKWRGYNEHN